MHVCVCAVKGQQLRGEEYCLLRKNLLLKTSKGRGKASTVAAEAFLSPDGHLNVR